MRAGSEAEATFKKQKNLVLQMGKLEIANSTNLFISLPILIKCLLDLSSRFLMVQYFCSGGGIIIPKLCVDYSV